MTTEQLPNQGEGDAPDEAHAELYDLLVEAATLGTAPPKPVTVDDDREDEAA